MLGASDSKLFELYAEDKGNFSTTSTKDAAARRDAKIARFRQEKDLKRKLEVRAIFQYFTCFLFMTHVCLVSSTKPQSCRE
jgi:hypothetical protein